MKRTLALVSAVAACIALPAPARSADPDFATFVDERPVYTFADNDSTRALRDELVREVAKIVAAGRHLAPLRVNRGIIGDVMVFGNPADTVHTLCAVADLLDDDLRAKALAHARMLVAKYPPWQVGWEADGLRRELWPLPPEAAPKNPQQGAGPTPGNLYVLWRYADATGDWQTAGDNIKAITAFYNTFSRARAVEAVKAAGRAPAIDQQVRINAAGVASLGPRTVELVLKLSEAADAATETFKDDGKGKLVGSLGGSGQVDYHAGLFTLKLGKPATLRTGETRPSVAWTLNAQAVGKRTYDRVAGMIGYARLTAAIGADDAAAARDAAIASVREAAQIGYAGMYKMAFAQFGSKRGHDWMYAPFHSRRDAAGNTTVMFCPEVGRLLHETDADAVATHLAGYEDFANTRGWFLHFGDMPGDGVNTSRTQETPGGEAMGGENAVFGPDYGWTVFMLQAHAIGAAPEKLEGWIDIPHAKIGDLCHIERLAAAIRAFGTTDWKPISK